VIGIYGVLAYVVSQRVREIGIRIALGGTVGRIFTMVLREGFSLVAAGLAFGLAGAVGIRHVIQGQIYGVKPLDPAVIGITMAILGAFALAACVLPARRASLVDPIKVLSA
jgi:ABC-type antimicrobial peptide transport system permease subunit